MVGLQVQKVGLVKESQCPRAKGKHETNVENWVCGGNLGEVVGMAWARGPWGAWWRLMGALWT